VHSLSNYIIIVFSIITFCHRGNEYQIKWFWKVEGVCYYLSNTHCLSKYPHEIVFKCSLTGCTRPMCLTELWNCLMRSVSKTGTSSSTCYLVKHKFWSSFSVVLVLCGCKWRSCLSLCGVLACVVSVILRLQTTSWFQNDYLFAIS